MKNQMTKDNWVALFRDIGLDDAKMKQWHKLFEVRHPEGHQSFLEWLGIPAQEAAAIRERSK